MRVGYLGPAGTFSEEALRGSPAAADAEPVPFTSIHDAVVAVQAGGVDRALVPIENALEGGVTATLDALAADAPDVVVVGERVLAIRTCLLARAPLELDAVALVVSHPQPLAQCARFLRAALPGAALRAVASTAEAVREVVACDDAWAALAPRGAAERYGAVVLREGIDDEPGNATRFVWLAHAGAGAGAPDAVPGSGWKTSVLFAGAGDAQPGWLVRCLSEFAFRGVNLTRIESRPRRSRLGHYLFHVDLEGTTTEPRVDAAIEGLRAHCEEVRLLGSYPAAAAPER
jgi:prephenate dehydratase